VAGTSLFAAMPTSVQFISCIDKGNLERENLLSHFLHPFVRLGLDTGAAISAFVDNNTSSSSPLKGTNLSFIP
jgi:hypothetical protein